MIAKWTKVTVIASVALIVALSTIAPGAARSPIPAGGKLLYPASDELRCTILGTILDSRLARRRAGRGMAARLPRR